MKLENRNGAWKYADKVWIIPNEGTQGFIEDQNSPGNVLGIMKAIGPEVILAKGTSSKIGKEVILESKNNPIEKTQTWITGAKDADGWFMIKDDANELILTAKSDDANPVVENNCFSTCLGRLSTISRMQ